MEISGLLVKLRKDRGFSQEFLSKNITSRNSLIHYEKGKNNIPFNILIELLERMNMSIDEFVFYLQKDSMRNNNEVAKKMIKNIRSGKHSRSHTLEKLRIKVEESHNIADIRNYLLVRVYDWFQRTPDDRKLNKKDESYFLILSNYLEQVDEWGRFEMSTFSSLLFLFKTNYIQQRLNEIEKKIEKNGDFEIFHLILLGTYNNSILLMIERKELKLAKVCLGKLENLQRRTLFAQNMQIYFQFYSLLISYVENSDLMKEQMKEYFKALKIIGADEMVRAFMKDLSNVSRTYNLPNHFGIEEDLVK